MCTSQRDHEVLPGSNIWTSHIKKQKNFPGGPVIKKPLQGAWVQSLVGELRSCKSYGNNKQIKIIF